MNGPRYGWRGGWDDVDAPESLAFPTCEEIARITSRCWASSHHEHFDAILDGMRSYSDLVAVAQVQERANTYQRRRKQRQAKPVARVMWQRVQCRCPQCRQPLDFRVPKPLPSVDAIVCGGCQVRFRLTAGGDPYVQHVYRGPWR